MSVNRYLKRMDASMDDKMKVLQFIPDDAQYVLDVGCASGHVTRGMANLRPSTYFHGVEVSLPFVGMANAENDASNVGFSRNWLSDLHSYGTQYDAITFMSVLHEFYSYGEGVTSVVKALCDAYELLNYGGVLIIRDMLRPDNKSNMGDRIQLVNKLDGIPNVKSWLSDYDLKMDLHTGIQGLNDFLLHMLYTDNWANEIRERYMFWSAQDYVNFAQYLNLDVEAVDCYLLDYVSDRWKKELWLNQMELSNLYSTGIVVLRK